MKKLFILAVAVSLSACASLGIQPKTFNERLATGYSSVTTVRQAALTLLNAGEITSNDAQNIQNSANTVRQGLDVADTLYKAKPQDGEEKLVATLKILRVLETYVEDKK